MGQLSHNFKYVNSLAINPTVFAEQLLTTQRKLLASVVELMFVPLLAKASETSRRVETKRASKSKLSIARPSIASVLTAKLADPALSFTKAVETAEPLFDILSDEEI